MKTIATKETITLVLTVEEAAKLRFILDYAESLAGKGGTWLEAAKGANEFHNVINDALNRRG